MRPEIDASDKQIFQRNKFRTNADNLLFYLSEAGASEKADIFRPKILGEYGNPYDGTSTGMVENGIVRDPDFQLKYLLGESKKKPDRKNLQRKDKNQKN